MSIERAINERDEKIRDLQRSEQAEETTRRYWQDRANQAEARAERLQGERDELRDALIELRAATWELLQQIPRAPYLPWFDKVNGILGKQAVSLQLEGGLDAALASLDQATQEEKHGN